MYSTIQPLQAVVQVAKTVAAAVSPPTLPTTETKSVQATAIGFIDNIKSETLKQTVATQKQLNDFNERCEQVITNIKALNQDSYQIIDLLILQLMAVAEYTIYCGRQANFDFKKYQLFQNYFLYQFQLYINSMFSSVSFLFYYFFQPFGHRVNQMIDDIQRDSLQRPLYFFIQQVICGTFFRGNV
ncbi:Hypothetical_protein [Hexamita inflata]|uniref:Hypothetical_protein n=1 Tax=Hexamita inflata TaxID=28002 RepID=A0AA86RIZ7_9EUKA|nr:Hypothetical protein HINF_LOCUS63313 [Hexamita inflata]